MADREKVIKGLETCSDVYYGADGACSSCPYSQTNGDRCLAELVYDAIDLLKEQGAVEPTVGGWVSVKDMLPENETKVLVFTAWGDQAVWEYYTNISENQCWLGDDDIIREKKDVMYWMPLPEPPKEDEENADD